MFSYVLIKLQPWAGTWVSGTWYSYISALPGDVTPREPWPSPGVELYFLNFFFLFLPPSQK